MVLSFCILFVLSAYRDISVGTDTVNYQSFFYRLQAGIIQDFKVEPGWVFLNEMVLNLGGDFYSVLILSTIIVLAPIYFIAFKLSPNPMLSISLYHLLYFYLYSFNITRQTIALSLIILGTYALLKRKKLIFIFFIAIASLFHYSAIIASLLLLSNKMPVNFKITSSSIVVAMFIGLFGYQALLSLISMTGYVDLLEHANYELASLYSSFLILLFYNLFFIFILLSISKDLKNTLYFKLFFMSFIFVNLAIRIPYGNRLFIYFTIIQIIFIPLYLNNLNPTNRRYKLYISLAVLAYAYINFLRLMGNGEIFPYHNILLN